MSEKLLQQGMGSSGRLRSAGCAAQPMTDDDFPFLTHILAELERRDWPGRRRVDLSIRCRDSEAIDLLQTCYSPSEVADQIRHALMRARQMQALLEVGREITGAEW